jgi:Uma2 family endonuclease
MANKDVVMSNLTFPPEIEEAQDMGSYNHSLIQANLAFLLNRLGKYSVFTELSLDSSQLDPNTFRVREEIKPDVCIYPKRGLSRPFDILKMAEAPLLAVEILSPQQGAQEILEKFALYFALGVRACWLVDPTTAIVAVYSTLEQPKTFSSGEVVDEMLAIRLPLAEIFE